MESFRKAGRNQKKKWRPTVYAEERKTNVGMTSNERKVVKCTTSSKQLGKRKKDHLIGPSQARVDKEYVNGRRG